MLSALIQLTTTQRETIHELDRVMECEIEIDTQPRSAGECVLLISPPATSCQALFRPLTHYFATTAL